MEDKASHLKVTLPKDTPLDEERSTLCTASALDLHFKELPYLSKEDKAKRRSEE